MSKKMGIGGVGPRIVRPAFFLIILAYIVTRLQPGLFQFAHNKSTLYPFLWPLLVIGLVLWIGSAVQLVRGFRKGKLICSGFYAVFLNPLYDAFILFLIPALSLYLNSWLCLIGSLVLLLAMKKNVKEEENYLRTTFGKDYEDYRKKVIIRL